MSKATSPVFGGFANPPKPLPCGVPFKDRVSIRDIDYRSAGRVYQSHHSYVSEPRTSGTPVHHGVYFDDRLAGAISFSYMLCSEPINGVEPENTMEVSRACIALDMPNLASCSMAKAQKKFVEDYARENDIEQLVTYVREDYDGTMFKALRGLGWQKDGVSKGHQAGNRPEREIRSYDKTRWVCPL